LASATEAAKCVDRRRRADRQQQRLVADRGEARQHVVGHRHFGLGRQREQGGQHADGAVAVVEQRKVDRAVGQGRQRAVGEHEVGARRLDLLQLCDQRCGVVRPRVEGIDAGGQRVGRGARIGAQVQLGGGPVAPVAACQLRVVLQQRGDVARRAGGHAIGRVPLDLDAAGVGKRLQREIGVLARADDLEPAGGTGTQAHRHPCARAAGRMVGSARPLTPRAARRAHGDFIRS
jgi:hypothetical protein